MMRPSPRLICFIGATSVLLRSALAAHQDATLSCTLAVSYLQGTLKEYNPTHVKTSWCKNTKTISFSFINDGREVHSCSFRSGDGDLTYDGSDFAGIKVRHTHPDEEKKNGFFARVTGKTTLVRGAEIWSFTIDPANQIKKSKRKNVALVSVIGEILDSHKAGKLTDNAKTYLLEMQLQKSKSRLKRVDQDKPKPKSEPTPAWMKKKLRSTKKPKQISPEKKQYDQNRDILKDLAKKAGEFVKSYDDTQTWTKEGKERVREYDEWISRYVDLQKEINTYENSPAYKADQDS